MVDVGDSTKKNCLMFFLLPCSNSNSNSFCFYYYLVVLVFVGVL